MDPLVMLFEVAETSWDGLWLIDFEGQILHANWEAGQVCGVERPSGPVWNFLPERDHGRFREHLIAISQGGEPAAEATQTFQRADGTTAQAVVNESLYADLDGRVIGVLQRIVDARRNEAVWKAHRASQIELTEAQLSVRGGNWSWDLERDEVEATAAVLERFAWAHRTLPLTSDEALELFHEADRDLVAEAVRRCLLGDEHQLAVTARMRVEGEWRWVCARATATLDTQNRVIAVSGTLADVDDTVATELALKDQTAQYGLMHTVSVAANGAASLDEVIRLSRDLILVHDDWSRGLLFLIEDDQLVPSYPDDSSRLEDEQDPERFAREVALARAVLATDELVWDDARLTIAVPIHYEGQIYAVMVATSSPPLYRHAMVEEFSRHMAMQVELVIEREQSAIQLAQARDDAMAASRQKSQFLAMMTHEIRTPLNGLIGLNELLLRTDLTDEQRRLALGAETSGKALLALINDTLDLSKAEAGALTLEDTVFDMRAVVGNVLTPVEEGARVKGVRLEVRYGAVPDRLRGDPVRLTQVIGNLVSNALKFTSTGAIVVKVNADPVPTGGAGEVLLRCAITDTGIGIDPGVGDLFEPFRQAEASTTRRFGGTGLGLAICREIVDAMGGQIGYESALGEGSTFKFEVPLQVALEQVGPESATPAGTELTGKARSARILVVEDHPINQEVAVGMLTSLGQHVQVVEDAESALALLATQEFDLVFMDVHLPGMSGCEATKLIRDHESADSFQHHLPVVGMSAAASVNEQQGCLNAGMDDFLLKPVDLSRLANTLRVWLGTEPGNPESDTGVEPDVEPGREADRESDMASAAPPADAAPFESPDLDLTRLQMLRELGEDDLSYLVKTIASFAARRDTDFGALADAVEAGVAEQVRFAAHRLAGSADNISAARVAALAREFELAPESLLQDEGAAKLAQLSQALDVACAELARYVQELSPNS